MIKFIRDYWAQMFAAFCLLFMCATAIYIATDPAIASVHPDPTILTEKPVQRHKACYAPHTKIIYAILSDGRRALIGAITVWEPCK